MCAQSPTPNQSTFLPEGSRASLTVLPGSEEAQKMTVTSGRNISGLLERQDRDTSLPRTFLESCPPISTRCYLTWKVKATPAGRSIFQLAPSMPRTDESESSLWPTPKAVMVEEEYEGWRSRMAGYSDPKSNTKTKPDNLAVAVKMWPTPDASPRGPRAMELVGQTGRSVERRKSGQQRGIDLQTAAKMWPTPRASEWKDTGPVGSKSHAHMDKRDYLCAKVKDVNQPTGQLNPAWVEWLMGFPSGFTDLED